MKYRKKKDRRNAIVFFHFNVTMNITYISQIELIHHVHIKISPLLWTLDNTDD